MSEQATPTLDFSFLRGAPVAVLGLGKSGMATATALQASGVDVAAWDDQPAAREAAKAHSIPLVDLNQADLGRMQFLALSPGIPLHFPTPHPVATRAKAAGCAIIGDIELLYRAEPEARYIGITGTNGKSTTTSLIGHILAEAGMRIAVGGNLGTAVLTFPALGSGGAYVLEMSSYQLDLIDTLVFDAAVLLNITPDHLDRHGGMDGYIAAKERIFAGQTGPKAAIVGIDTAPSSDIAKRLAARGHARLIPISVGAEAPAGVSVIDGWLIDDLDGGSVREIDLKAIRRLPGVHNWQNAAAAWAVARVSGVPKPVIIEALKSFPGLVHRQQLVRTIGDIAFVDDSKATNVDAAEKALASYDRIYWIAGGRAKEGGLSGLEPFIKPVVHAFLVGEAAEDFATWLEGKVPTTIVGTIDRAVAAAYAMAEADGQGGVVLLSPACASFDQFPNFEVRGRFFLAAVNTLPKTAGGGA
ncbi:MAG: UDP-N-acetylmuramoyl-L-alanine--D-glutamate ligase [Rhodospirillales bacterium]|nr:UDP-N-acetylmuramoyl-L-alanine--D-glutamate ligase [Rhodospirillales bacterium]